MLEEEYPNLTLLVPSFVLPVDLFSLFCGDIPCLEVQKLLHGDQWAFAARDENLRFVGAP